MDFLNKLVGGDGCADGQASASNPIGQVVDALLPVAGAAMPVEAGMEGYRDGPQLPAELRRIGDAIFDAPPHAAMHMAPPPMAAADGWADEYLRRPQLGARPMVAPGFEAAWEGAGAFAEEEKAWEAAAAPQAALEGAWEASAAAPGPLEEAWEAAAPAGALEDAWSEAAAEEVVGAGSRAGMEAAWARTQERLESLNDGEAYAFAEQNSFLDHADPIGEGRRLFAEGRLGRAVEAFEAAVQRDAGNAEAWRLLGNAHAENEEDVRAIKCLEQAVELDPYSLDALLALGVSYVNELEPERALRNLKAWVELNPKYAGLEVLRDEYSDNTLMDEVQSLMLQAAAHDASDADVQVVLGVLYNVSEDYESAATALRNAIASRPEDYSLHNKLGATLANAQRSEEALPAYHTAIDLKPQYARAWLNMGIAHSNMGNSEQAARSFLQALALNPRAKHIWAFVRVVFMEMDRFDLVQQAGRESVLPFVEEFGLMLGEAAEAKAAAAAPAAGLEGAWEEI